MAWRLAESLKTIRNQADWTWPLRSTVSDGTIGDEAHQDSTSDHNPRLIAGLGSIPVVTARDITHDPAHGVDCARIGELLRVSRDPRIKYWIFNRRMFSSTNQPWVWRPYSGDNPHTHHGHLSVVSDVRADDKRPWSIGALMALRDDEDFRALIFRIHGLLSLADPVDLHVNNVKEGNKLGQAIKRIETAVNAPVEIALTSEQLDDLALKLAPRLAIPTPADIAKAVLDAQAQRLVD